MSDIAQPKNMAIRPLNKGMVLNISSLHIPDEACRLASNFTVTERGLRRRPGLETYNSLTTVDEPVVDIATVWRTGAGTDGQGQNQVLISELYVYQLSTVPEVAPTRITYTFTEGTIDVSGTLVTLTTTGDDWSTGMIQPGDLLEVGAETGVIASKSESVITLEQATITDQTGVSYTITSTFNPRVRPDWDIISEELIIADGKHPLMVLDPELQTLREFTDSANQVPEIGAFIAHTVTFINGRTWAANLIEPEGDGTKRQRIRWSTLSDPADFSLDTAYIDLPRIFGEIVRMAPLGDSLVVYSSNKLFIGSPTNNPNLPLAFQEVDTGGIGLVGNKALYPWIDGHFWVGEDDIYFFSNKGNERVGTPVLRDTILKCEHQKDIYVTSDHNEERMLFGFPGATPRQFDKIWSFSYKTGAWAYDNLDATMIANPLPNYGLSWLDLSAFTWDGANNPLSSEFAAWNLMRTDAERRKVFLAHDGALYYYNARGKRDKGDIQEPIYAEFESKDYDFDAPDIEKYFLRLSVKIGFDEPLGGNLRFAVWISNNRGRSWRRVGYLKIKEGMDEGYATFTSRASHMRVRLASSSEVRPYWIEELVWRARAAGREETGRTQIGYPG